MVNIYIICRDVLCGGVVCVYICKYTYLYGDIQWNETCFDGDIMGI
jgi:hypothetical protein